MRLIFRRLDIEMDLRHGCAAEMEFCPRCGYPGADGRFKRPGVGFEDILPDRGLGVAVAHAGTVGGTGQLPDQQRIDRVVGEFQGAEIDIVAAGVGSVQQFQLGRFGEDAAAVGTEIADQTVEDLPFVVPGVLVDFGDQERHPEAFDETEEILDGPVLETVEPGEDADQTGPGRIGFAAGLVEDETVARFLFRHPVGKFIADQPGDETFPQREMDQSDRLAGLRSYSQAAIWS